MIHQNVLLTIVISFTQCIGGERFQCMNNDNDPVDWFVIYKLPDVNSHKNPLLQQGLAFLYQDTNSVGNWQLSEKAINSTRGTALVNTMRQLYNAPKTLTYRLLYNDDHPNEKSDSYRGHTKGVQLFDAASGFWLIHSVPEFAPIEKFSYPSSGTRNGQSFMCVTFDTDANIDKIAQLLYLNQPSIYLKGLPKSWITEHPLLYKVTQGKSETKGPFARQLTLTSRGGREFVAFAKHRKWKKDLYSELVAPGLQQSIYTETWLNGAGDLDKSCDTKYHTQDIFSMRLDHVSFSNSKDHSKWTITTKPSPHAYVCVGDINRQASQSKRGGGTLCLDDVQLWGTYDGGIGQVAQCDDGDTGGSYRVGMNAVVLCLALFWVCW